MPKDKPYSSYIKYSGIAVKMIVLILIGAFLGKWLDSKFESGVVFTAISTLFFVGISLYVSLKDFIK